MHFKKKKNEQKGRRSRTESSRMPTKTGEKGKNQQATEQSKTKCMKPNQTPERGYLESRTQ